MLFLLFLSFAVGLECIPRVLYNRTNIIPCFQIADMDHNQELSEMEVALFLDSHPTYHTTVTKIMNFCDIDQDGKLTLVDLQSQDSCMRFASVRLFVCEECNKLL